MIGIAQSNLVVVGLDKVFWKGTEIHDIKSMELKKTKLRTEFKINVKAGSNQNEIILEMVEAGISIKETK